ncbi:MAG: hypothetical protein IT384_19580 [Deltaproteobacteria bacterium]|nr:hypothetical protein [Deltaproteobacteria bacterium]
MKLQNAIRILLLTSIATACGGGLPQDDFESFRLSLPRTAEGAYVVERDLRLYGDEELADYYEKTFGALTDHGVTDHGVTDDVVTDDGVTDDGEEEISSALTVAQTTQTVWDCPPPPQITLPVCQVGSVPPSCQDQTFVAPINITVWTCDLNSFPPACGDRTIDLRMPACTPRGVTTDQIWTPSERMELSYCLSDDLGSSRATLTTTLRAAARSWERVAPVRFIHRTDLDGAGCNAQTPVTFDVHLSAGDPSWAFAFFPRQSRDRRNVQVGSAVVGSVSLMTHELGHVLGFRHEQIRGAKAGCFSESASNSRGVTTYDQRSIMHYWQAECDGTADSQVEITPRDAQGAQRLYGGPIRTRQVALRTADGCFLSATNGGGTLISGQKSWIGPWESFDLVDVGGNKVALRGVDSGQFVRELADGAGTLAANHATLQPGSTFTSISLGGRVVNLKTASGRMVNASCSMAAIGSNAGGQLSNQLEIIPLDEREIALQAPNGRYVDSLPQPMVNSGRIYRSERMYLVELGSNQVALRSRSGVFARADGGGGGRIYFDRNIKYTHETFTLEVQPGERRIALKTYSGRHYVGVSGGALVAIDTAPVVLTQIEMAGERISLKAYSGQLVSAIGGGGEGVRVIGASVGPAETLRMVRVDGDRTRVALRAQNGQYLTVSATGILEATSDSIDSAQRLVIQGAGGNGACFWYPGNGRFITAEGGGGREMIANRTWCSTWETFVLQ